MASFLKSVDWGGLVFLLYIKLSSCASVEIKGKESSIHMRNRIGHLTVTVRNKTRTEITENTAVYTIFFKHSVIERNYTKSSSLSRFQMNITSAVFTEILHHKYSIRSLCFFFRTLNPNLSLLFHSLYFRDVWSIITAEIFLWKSHFCHVLEHTVCEW